MGDIGLEDSTWLTAARVAIIVVSGYLLYQLLYRLNDWATRRAINRAPEGNTERLENAGRLIKSLIKVLVFAVTVIAIILSFGVSPGDLLLGPWRGYIHALMLIVAAHFTIRFGTLIIDGVFDRAETDERVTDKARAKTGRGLLKSVLRYTVDIAAWILVLSNLGINTTGLLASVGVAGIAIGFGAQSLVRDVITGFFILFEDQFFVGDYIETAGVSGIVQEIGLRVTKIQDFGGQVHIIPNGQIDKVTNYSVGPMRVMFEIPIAYGEDVNKAIETIEKVCQEFAQGDERIVDEPKVLGVTGWSDSAYNITVWGRAQPMQQWAVGRDLRRAIKLALDEAGIKPPYPTRVWITGLEKPSSGGDASDRA